MTASRESMGWLRISMTILGGSWNSWNVSVWMRIQSSSLRPTTAPRAAGTMPDSDLQKGDVYEGGIRVPYFMRWPKGMPAGFKTDKIASHIDVLPTLLSLCNVDSPSDLRMDGVDLTPLIRGREVAWPDRTLFIQTHRGSRPRQYHNCTAITQRYKWLGYPSTGGTVGF